MSGKSSSHILILMIAFCVSPMKIAIGQAGPSSGYGKIPRGAYSIIAEVRAKPGKREELHARHSSFLCAVTPRILTTSFRKTVRVRGHFIFYEVFPTKEDFEAHNNMPYVKEWFSKLPKLAEGGVKITRMEVQPATRE